MEDTPSAASQAPLPTPEPEKKRKKKRKKKKKKKSVKSPTELKQDPIPDNPRQVTAETSKSPEAKDGLPFPQEIEVATVIYYKGLWYDLTLIIKGEKIVDKLIGPGDMQQMAIERGVGRIVSFAERQRAVRVDV